MGAQSASYTKPVTSLRFASKPGTNFVDPLLQFGKVRSWPVDLFAARTAAELVIINFGKRLEFVDYLGLGCLLQWSITSETARERRDEFQKVKTVDNLNGLFVGVLRAWAISVLNHGMHKQSSITRQKRPVFAGHHLQQFLVASVLVVSYVEAEEAQVARELTEVAINNKDQYSRMLQMFIRTARATMSDRKNLHFSRVGHRLIKTDALPIYHNHVNFRMWNATRFDDIFYRCFFSKAPLDYSVARS